MEMTGYEQKTLLKVWKRLDIIKKWNTAVKNEGGPVHWEIDVQGAFVWSQTSEGSSYWGRVNEALIERDWTLLPSRQHKRWR